MAVTRSMTRAQAAPRRRPGRPRRSVKPTTAVQRRNTRSQTKRSPEPVPASKKRGPAKNHPKRGRGPPKSQDHARTRKVNAAVDTHPTTSDMAMPVDDFVSSYLPTDPDVNIQSGGDLPMAWPPLALHSDTQGQFWQGLSLHTIPEELPSEYTGLSSLDTTFTTVGGPSFTSELNGSPNTDYTMVDPYQDPYQDLYQGPSQDLNMATDPVTDPSTNRAGNDGGWTDFLNSDDTLLDMDDSMPDLLDARQFLPDTYCLDCKTTIADTATELLGSHTPPDLSYAMVPATAPDDQAPSTPPSDSATVVDPQLAMITYECELVFAKKTLRRAEVEAARAQDREAEAASVVLSLQSQMRTLPDPSAQVTLDTAAEAGTQTVVPDASTESVDAASQWISSYPWPAEATLFPEVTPEMLHEVMPEMTPGVTTEAMPEGMPEISEVMSEIPEMMAGMPEVMPEMTPEVMLEVTPELTPEDNLILLEELLHTL